MSRNAGDECAESSRPSGADIGGIRPIPGQTTRGIARARVRACHRHRKVTARACSTRRVSAGVKPHGTVDCDSTGARPPKDGYMSPGDRSSYQSKASLTTELYTGLSPRQGRNQPRTHEGGRRRVRPRGIRVIARSVMGGNVPTNDSLHGVRIPSRGAEGAMAA